jgi:hypothetical protein
MVTLEEWRFFRREGKHMAKRRLFFPSEMIFLSLLYLILGLWTLDSGVSWKTIIAGNKSASDNNRAFLETLPEGLTLWDSCTKQKMHVN